MKSTRIWLLPLFIILALTAYAQESVPVVTYNGKDYYKYEVKPKETLYGLSKRFGISQEELMAMNPFLNDGMKIGQVLTIPVHPSVSPDLSVAESAVVQTPIDAQDNDSTELYYPENETVYTVTKRREKLVDIAEQLGISLDALRMCNPNVPNLLRKGSVLYLPSVAVVKPDNRSEEPDIEIKEDTSIVTILHSELATESKEKVSVALLLPLMIDDTTAVSTERYVEFYEGLLLAADTLRRLGKHIDLAVYDIGRTLYRMQFVLTHNSFDGVDFVIAAANSDQIAYLSSWSLTNRKKVILPFSSRIQETAVNSYFYQVNPPHHITYERLLALDIASLQQKNVILYRSTKEENDERAQLFKAMKRKLTDQHIAYREFVEYGDNTKAQDSLARYFSSSLENLVMVAPLSLSESNRVISVINAAKVLASAKQVSVWGYPEWMALGKSNLPLMYALNVSFYTNYYADFKRPELRQFVIDYGCSFGRDMLNTFPRYAMMGYDIMLHFAFETYGIPSTVSPLQHRFDFVQTSSSSGFYNQTVYLVNYDASRSISTHLLP